jgi:Na+-translocating ferredoxin:NAD+ oxidoreductase RnfG subunit
MLSRRTFALGLMTQVAGLLPAGLSAQEGMFLTEATAPAAVFPQASRFERTVVLSTPELQAEIQRRLGKLRPSLWEPEYIVFTARQQDTLLGYGVIVEEIGKSRPITFIVGVGVNGQIAAVAVMAYREPYGGEVRYPRFLAQYAGKTLRDPLLPFRDIHNITGATLSCQSIGQGVHKALALVQAIFLKEGGS